MFGSLIILWCVVGRSNRCKSQALFLHDLSIRSKYRISGIFRGEEGKGSKMGTDQCVRVGGDFIILTEEVHDYGVFSRNVKGLILQLIWYRDSTELQLLVKQIQ